MNALSFWKEPFWLRRPLLYPAELWAHTVIIQFFGGSTSFPGAKHHRKGQNEPLQRPWFYLFLYLFLPVAPYLMAMAHSTKPDPGVRVLPPSGTNKSYRLRYRDPRDPHPDPNHRTTISIRAANRDEADTAAKAKTFELEELLKSLPEPPAAEPVPAQSSRRTRPKDLPRVDILKPWGSNKKYRLRFDNPATGDSETVSTQYEAASDPELVTDTAHKKARELQRIQEDVDANKLRVTKNSPLELVFKRYFATGNEAGPAVELDADTVKLNRRAVDNFLAWCATHKPPILTDHQILKSILVEYDISLVTRKVLIPNEGGVRGEYIESDECISAHTANRERRSLKRVLTWLSDVGVLRISLQDIRSAIKTRETVTDKTPLKPDQLRELMEACAAYDGATFKMDRRRRTDAKRYKPISDFICFVLFTAIRVQELWVRKDSILSGLKRNILIGSDVRETQINLPGTVAKRANKPGKARTIFLRKSSTLLEMAPKLIARGTSPLFDFTYDEVDAARKILIRDYGAPDFTFRQLRKTSSTYLMCAPGIYGGGSATYHLVCAELGHDPEVNQDFYTSELHIDPKAKTLEQAMGLEAIPADAPSSDVNAQVAELQAQLAQQKAAFEIAIRSITQAKE